jgi:nucleotidyltransferase/DNA polymerase involved in DNA repair
VSDAIFEIFMQSTALVEPLSIDEAFLDVTGSIRIYGDGAEIARKIKEDIRTQQRLTGSIGVAPNKYLAKIASDLEKPDGLVIVYPEKIEEFLWPLDISRLWGAGEKTQTLLRQMGISSFGDLARFPKDILEQKFGKLGRHFYNLAHGIDDREVRTDHEVKSISNEHTFDHDVNQPDQLQKLIMHLSDKVGYRLRGQQLYGKTIHLKLRYEDFTTLTRNRTLPSPTDLTEIIYNTALDLFEKNYQTGRKVRLIGVGISGFGIPHGEQLSLFDHQARHTSRIDQLEDDLIKKYGKHIVYRAESLRKRKESRR